MTSNPEHPLLLPDNGIRSPRQVPNGTIDLPTGPGAAEFNPPDTKVSLPDLNLECAAAWRLVGWVLGDADTAHKAVTGSATQFNSLVSDDIESAGGYNQEAWQEACMVLTFAASVADLWYKDVAEFREERQQLIKDYKAAIANATILHSDRSPGSPPGQPDPHSPRQVAFNELQIEYERRGAALKAALEASALNRKSLLKGGPEPKNLKLLVKEGTLGWGVYNIQGADTDTPLPVSKKQAEKMASDLQKYLKDGKEPDARYHEIVAALTAVSAKAKELQRDNRATIGNPKAKTKNLKKEELEFLETFYSEFDKQSPRGLIRLMPWLAGSDEHDLSSSQQKGFTKAIANGLLVLSDEKVGGGQDRLPKSVQHFANGVTRVSVSPSGQPPGGFSKSWLGDARDFSLLLDRSNATDPEKDEDIKVHGGTEFSANMALSMGFHLENHGDKLEDDYDKGLSKLLGVTNRNVEASHRILIDKHEHPMSTSQYEDYAQRTGMPDFSDNSKALAGLYAYDWEDDGKRVSGLTNWIPRFKEEGPEERTDMAGEAALGLIETLAGTGGDDPDHPFHDTGNTSGSGHDRAVTEINSELTIGLTKVYLAYEDDFILSGKNEYAPIDRADATLPLHRRDETALQLQTDTKKDFLRLLIADDKNSGIIAASAEGLERRIIDSAIGDKADTSAAVAGTNSGEMRSILHDAMIEEYTGRKNDREEAKAQAADAWQSAFNITVAISNGTLGSIPGAGTPAAVGTEALLRLLEHPGKEDFLDRLEQEEEKRIEQEKKDKGEGEKPVREIIDSDTAAEQHAQRQLLQVYLDRGAISADDLKARELLPEDHNGGKEEILSRVSTELRSDPKGYYPILEEALQDASRSEDVNGGHKNWLSTYLDKFTTYYEPKAYKMVDED